MIRHNELARRLKTAKHGTVTGLSGVITVLKHIVFNGIHCDFSAATDGSYYILAEGIDPSQYTGDYEFLLVAPDNTPTSAIDWDRVYGLTVTAALEYFYIYTTNRSIPGWDAFTEWFDTNLAQYMFAVSSIEVFGNTLPVSDIPQYSNPNHKINIWFQWLEDCCIAAGVRDVSMASIATNRKLYVMPITLHAGNLNATVSFQLTQ